MAIQPSHSSPFIPVSPNNTTTKSTTATTTTSGGGQPISFGGGNSSQVASTPKQNPQLKNDKNTLSAMETLQKPDNYKALLEFSGEDGKNGVATTTGLYKMALHGNTEQKEAAKQMLKDSNSLKKMENGNSGAQTMNDGRFVMDELKKASAAKKTDIAKQEAPQQTQQSQKPQRTSGASDNNNMMMMLNIIKLLLEMLMGKNDKASESAPASPTAGKEAPTTQNKADFGNHLNNNFDKFADKNGFVTPETLQKMATEGSGKDKETAQFFLSNPEAMREMDNAKPGVNKGHSVFDDGKIDKSDANLFADKYSKPANTAPTANAGATQATPTSTAKPSLEKTADMATHLGNNFDKFKGKDGFVTPESLQKMATEGSGKDKEVAQFFLDNPKELSKMDNAKVTGMHSVYNDAKIDKTDAGMYAGKAVDAVKKQATDMASGLVDKFDELKGKDGFISTDSLKNAAANGSNEAKKVAQHYLDKPEELSKMDNAKVTGMNSVYNDNKIDLADAKLYKDSMS